MAEEKGLILKEELAVVKPLVDPDQAVMMWKEYEALKSKLVDKERDVQVIEGKEWLKKSFWRKLDKCFRLDLQLISEKEEYRKIVVRPEVKKYKTKDGKWYSKTVYRVIGMYPMNFDVKKQITLQPKDEIHVDIVFSVIYRAIAPNGQFVDGDGHCSLWEKGYPNTYHNAKSTAHTRAKNRAISDLVGGGEVSAEEITGDPAEGTETLPPVIDLPPEPEENRTQPKNPPPTKKQETTKSEMTQSHKRKIFALLKQAQVERDDMKSFIDFTMAGAKNKKDRAKHIIESFNEWLGMWKELREYGVIKDEELPQFTEWLATTDKIADIKAVRENLVSIVEEYLKATKQDKGE